MVSNKGVGAESMEGRGQEEGGRIGRELMPDRRGESYSTKFSEFFCRFLRLLLFFSVLIS